MKKMFAVMSLMLLTSAAAYAAIPQYSDDSGLSKAMMSLVNWLCFGIGPGAVAIAFVIFGYRLMNGDKDAWPHSKNLIIGAIVIALAGAIAKFIMSLSGVTSLQ